MKEKRRRFRGLGLDDQGEAVEVTESQIERRAQKKQIQLVGAKVGPSTLKPEPKHKKNRFNQHVRCPESDFGGP
jgi:hypothetical protein